MIFIVGAGVILGMLMLAGVYLVLNASGFVGPMVSRRFRSPMMGPSNLPLGRYDSNGECIYFSGVSRSGDVIQAQMPGMHRMPAGGMACADCHTPEVRGGTFRMMMGTYAAPDIRCDTLTAGEHEHEGGGEEQGEHPP